MLYSHTNKLVRFYEGVDGLKTGFTTTAGYCITTTAKRNNMRLLSVVMNAPTSDLRSKDTTNMLNYGFNSYQLTVLFDKEKSLGKVKVEKGVETEVDAYLKEDVTILSKISEEEKNYDYHVVVEELTAPIRMNQKVGYVEVVDSDGNIIKEEDVILKQDVKKAGLFLLFSRILESLSSGILS